MATLAAQTVTDMAVLLASATIIDLSQQRTTTGTEDTTKTARVADMAAAKVKSYLGDVDGTDVQALDICIRLAMLYYSGVYSFMNTTQEPIQNIFRELDELRQSRLAEILPQLGQVDLSELDKVYPTNPLWNSDEE